jgi:DNA-binding response OmpR family regulator
LETDYRILVCDDTESVHQSLKTCFSASGMKMISAYNGMEALEKFRLNKPDLMILDLVMPKLSGIEVCKEIRKTSDVPIVMLTVMGDEIERIVGIEIGADDYIVKPFSTREVLARVKRILKRTAPEETPPKVLDFKDIRIDLERYEVVVFGKNIDLTPKEMQILFFLASHSNKVLSREQILAEVWGYNYLADTRIVDTHVKRLRKKLESLKIDSAIRTIYGVGYKFEA